MPEYFGPCRPLKLINNQVKCVYSICATFLNKRLKILLSFYHILLLFCIFIMLLFIFSFLSEREAADRNYAIGFYMKENKCYPEKANLKDIMDFYFQVCNIIVS